MADSTSTWQARGQNFVVTERKGQGRFLVANRDIQKEELILDETPVICTQLSWNRIHNFKACSHCLSPLQTAEESARHLTGSAGLHLPYSDKCETRPSNHVVCPQCLDVYCCKVCFEEALSKYHMAICQGENRLNPEHPINMLDAAWREFVGPVEEQSILLLVRLVALVKQSTDKDSIKADIAHFCSGISSNNDVELVMKMMGDKYQEKLERLRHLFEAAMYEESVKEWFTLKGFTQLLSLVGRNGQGIGTSSISIWARNCEAMDLIGEEKEKLSNFIDELYEKMGNEVGSFLNCEGVGLYKLQSLCNHSCASNAEIRFTHNSSTLSLVALRPIHTGEEITINYLSECERDRSRHSRQKLLREMYVFTCACERCVAEAGQEDVTSDEDDEDEESGSEDGEDMDAT